MSIIDEMPADFGTHFNKWVRYVILDLDARLTALEAQGEASAPRREGAANTPEPKEARQTTADGFPDWMRPHAQTKSTFKKKVAIMGFIPTKEEVQQRIAKLKPGVSYTKKQGAGIWNCSEAFALGWFFYIGHLVKLEFDTFSKSYKILEE